MNTKNLTTKYSPTQIWGQQERGAVAVMAVEMEVVMEVVMEVEMEAEVES